jgi:hypothetical protein
MMLAKQNRQNEGTKERGKDPDLGKGRGSLVPSFPRYVYVSTSARSLMGDADA